MDSSDTVPPAGITDLRAIEVHPKSVVLAWTASGNDSLTGEAAVYDLRYSKEGLDESNWDSAIQAPDEPAPQTAGSVEMFVVDGLDSATTYYFALKTGDEVPNWSPLSNVAIGDISPPSADIANPANDELVSGAVVVSVDAADNHRVDSVQFYVDRIPRFTDGEAPWSFTWNCSEIGDGSYHTIQASAYDAAGNTALSVPVNVFVRSDYIDSLPPRISTVIDLSALEILITFSDEGSGIDWDSVFVDVYDNTDNGLGTLLPTSKLIHTWILPPDVSAEVQFGPSETAVNLDFIDGIIGERGLMVVVYDGTRTLLYDGGCSCEYYSYPSGVPDRAGNHADVLVDPPLGPGYSPLVGDWQWVHSIGGIAGWESTPETAGYTLTYTYRHDGIFERRRDGVLELQTSYRVTEENPGIPEGSVVRYGRDMWMSQMISLIDDDTLRLTDLCFDCYVWTFVRGR